jgi:hypothetical protein
MSRSLPQQRRGIEAAGPAPGKGARDGCECEQEHGRPDKPTGLIGPRDAEELRGEQARGPCRGEESYQQARAGDAHAERNHQAPDVGGLSAEREADAEFVRVLLHEVIHCAIDPHERDEERREREAARQQAQRSRRRHRSRCRAQPATGRGP